MTQLNSAQRWVTYNQVVNGNPVVTNDQIQAAVLNPIPPQRAPQLLKDAGLLSTDLSKPFAPVDVRTYQRCRPAHHSRRHRRRQPDDAAEGLDIGNQSGQDAPGDAILRFAGRSTDEHGGGH
ncbi:MAG: hypothetical protein IPF60_00005 [Betaproteobacteria bacterium]|nr:hypothetical protein [Betaproteobacteria bacterium]